MQRSGPRLQGKRGVVREAHSFSANRLLLDPRETYHPIIIQSEHQRTRQPIPTMLTKLVHNASAFNETQTGPKKTPHKPMKHESSVCILFNTFFIQTSNHRICSFLESFRTRCPALRAPISDAVPYTVYIRQLCHQVKGQTYFQP